MAGDWIKMRACLQTHPKVVRIMSACDADKLRVVGGLHAVWCLFDEHSTDGRLDGYTLKTLDLLIGFHGFGAAMVAVGWLSDGGDFLETPRFEEHNGNSAKRRAQETDRKRAVRKVSASDADKKRTREEKRRDIPPTPETGADGFEAFWEAYPKKVGKDAAIKAFGKRKPDAEMLTAMLDAVRAQASSKAWTKDEGQFIPNPATWLNQGRWMDGEGTQGSLMQGAV